ncbi:MAG: hypothetical protein H8D45_20795 [Bacteroidetes bacterium]|nr:hypothetical protein [Bacteroidota bacterium]
MTEIGKRIAEFAIRASFDKDVTDLEKILKAQGAEIQRYHETEIHIRKPNYTTALILGSDPITCLSVIILALWGPHGMLLPEAGVAFKETNKQWKERNKKKPKEPKKKKAEQLTLDGI